jgi:hypothetical protein
VSKVHKLVVLGISGIGPIASSVNVLISPSGQLSTVPSAQKYKENITNMGNYSNDILKLQPVTFTYKVDETKEPQVGLIADEVYKIMPSLVVLNADQEIETVKYQDLPPMILNELIKQIS